VHRGYPEGKTIKVANIVPPGLLDAVLGGDLSEDYHLVLAEVALRYPKYLEFYRNRADRGEHVILDNGAYEWGTTPDFDLVVKVARKLRPTEIVLPDAMHGPDCAKRTTHLSAVAAEKYHWVLGTQITQFIAIPHGNTIDEWLLCATRLAKLPGVRVLGIAEKDAIKLTKGDRGTLIRAIKGLNLDTHLFGMMEDLRDMRDPWVQHAVRGVDGAKLVRWGLAGERVASGRIPPYPGRGSEYFAYGEEDIHPAQLDTVRANINYWRLYTSAEKGARREPAAATG
jgi:hypothetical protein